MANIRKSDSGPVLHRLAQKAADEAMALVVCDEASAAALPDAEQVPPSAFGERIELLLALGGDGTMLHAVRVMEGAAIPVLGVNLGSLGFLTSVPEGELEHALEVIAADAYSVSERALLDCRVTRDGTERARFIALNDIVVGWGASSRALTLGLMIDDEEVAQYLCDGLIVSTPTGSTGHSLSSGGPIVHPESPVMTVNVICPHTLSARPLVLPDRCMVKVQVLDLPPNKQPLLSADGQGEWVLKAGDWLSVTRHAHLARFAHLPAYSYFSVLRQKMHWRGSAREHR